MPFLPNLFVHSDVFIIIEGSDRQVCSKIDFGFWQCLLANELCKMLDRITGVSVENGAHCAEVQHISERLSHISTVTMKF